MSLHPKDMSEAKRFIALLEGEIDEIMAHIERLPQALRKVSDMTKQETIKKHYPHIHNIIEVIDNDKELIEYLRSITMYELVEGRGIRSGFTKDAFSELVTLLEDKVKHYAIKGTRNTSL